MNISSFYITKKHNLYENLLLTFTISILAYFLVFSKTNFEILVNIVDVFLEILVPSLFPFILFGNILTSSGCFELIASSKFCKIISLVLKISTYSVCAIIFGFLFGYPNGARYVNELYEKKKISFSEAEYLLLFVNNASPTFILSSIGIGMLKNIKLGVILLISHILSSILIGIIFRVRYTINTDISNTNNSKYYIKETKKQINLKLSFDVLYTSISKSLLTLGIIFGFMTISTLLYSYVITILEYVLPLSDNIKTYILSFMEVSSGLKQLTDIQLNLKILLPVISFFLGFSSLSIIFQIFSCVYLNKFKLSNLLKGKFMHGIFSFVITYILVNIPSIYEYINGSKEVNLNINYLLQDSFKYSHITISFIISLIYLFVFTIFLLYKKKRLSNKT